MPYIREQNWAVIDEASAKLLCHIENRLSDAGELNYMFTILAIQYVKAKGLNYRTLNEVVGVFHSAVSEFERRLVAPYEQVKIHENGDCYPKEWVS